MKNTAYRVLLLLLLAASLAAPLSFAEIVSFEGGVVGDPTMDEGVFEYEELFFLTGRPVMLKGTVELAKPPREGDRDYTLSYSYELRNVEENITLSRDVTFDVIEFVNESMQQTTFKADIRRLDESIDVDGTEYVLASYLFDESQLIDNTPAVDYFNGNLYAKRKYFINGNQMENDGTVSVEITSDSYVGYRHLWGKAETQVLLYDIRAQLPESEESGESSSWSGQVTLKMSSQTRYRFKYTQTDPQNISFRGNYIKTANDENVLQYTYNLPTVTEEGEVIESRRVQGEENLKSDIVVDSSSLITSKIRDIGGHWAEPSIYLLTSLEIFSADTTFFGPDLPVNRMDFAKAITKSIADVKPYTASELIKRDRNRDRAELYLDVDSRDPDIAFVEFVRENGLMAGEGNYFMPHRTLRRAEAITIMVNALGMTHLAPAPPYSTGFADDADIPYWARDAIYVANDIGLVTGYDDGTIRPDKLVTRAEAAVMLETFIRHIKDNITYDYREKIINRY